MKLRELINQLQALEAALGPDTPVTMNIEAHTGNGEVDFQMSQELGEATWADGPRNGKRVHLLGKGFT